MAYRAAPFVERTVLPSASADALFLDPPADGKTEPPHGYWRPARFFHSFLA